MLHYVTTIEIWLYLISNNCSNSKRRRSRTCVWQQRYYVISWRSANTFPRNSCFIVFIRLWQIKARETIFYSKSQRSGQSQGVCTDYDWLCWSWHTASAWTRGLSCSVSQSPPRWLISLLPRSSLKRCSTTWALGREDHSSYIHGTVFMLILVELCHIVRSNSSSSGTII